MKKIEWDCKYTTLDNWMLVGRWSDQGGLTVDFARIFSISHCCPTFLQLQWVKFSFSHQLSSRHGVRGAQRPKFTAVTQFKLCSSATLCFNFCSVASWYQINPACCAKNLPFKLYFFLEETWSTLKILTYIEPLVQSCQKSNTLCCNMVRTHTHTNTHHMSLCIQSNLIILLIWIEVSVDLR